MKSPKHHMIIAFMGLILMFVGCGSISDQNNQRNHTQNNEKPIELTISAAVSLTDALEEMQKIYESEHNVQLTFNLAGSGTLAQQIQQGAPMDIFISANQNWMNSLEEEELIDASTRENVTGNNLVLIAHKDSSLSYQSFEEINIEDVSEIAVGNPESVPAGGYTKNALKSLGMWDDLQDKIILAKNVRQVLTYIETGNADIGFVYESDALSSDDITILATAEAGHHDPIIYPGALIADSQHSEEAQAFLNYILSDEGQEILAKHGFKK